MSNEENVSKLSLYFHVLVRMIADLIEMYKVGLGSGLDVVDAGMEFPLAISLRIWG